jgi:hypothetical protein
MLKMKKIYMTLILLITLFSKPFAQAQQLQNGSVVISLNDSRFGGADIKNVFIILDKYDRTGAGIIQGKYIVENNKVILPSVPKGKYYVDVYTFGNHKIHSTFVMKVKKASNNHSLKLDNSMDETAGKTVIIPTHNPVKINEKIEYASN